MGRRAGSQPVRGTCGVCPPTCLPGAVPGAPSKLPSGGGPPTRCRIGHPPHTRRPVPRNCARPITRNCVCLAFSCTGFFPPQCRRRSVPAAYFFTCSWRVLFRGRSNNRLGIVAAQPRTRSNGGPQSKPAALLRAGVSFSCGNLC